MKKYFMTGTDNEIQFGENIELDICKENEEGTIVHKHLECVFCPEILDMLLEDNIVEEKEVFGADFDIDNEEENDWKFSNSFIHDLITKVSFLENKVNRLEEAVKKFGKK